MAASCWAGALLAYPVPLLAAVVAAAILIRSGRPGGVMIAAFVMASALAAPGAPAGHTGLPRDVSGEATLASDPEPIGRGVRFDVDFEGRRYEAVAWGAVAGDVRSRLLGERIDITGSVSAIESDSAWLALRGIEGRLSVSAVEAWRVGALHHRIANSIRRTIESGATVLPRDKQVLLVGLVYGDDRFQSDLVSDDFAAAGLTHLLAVSGQNVAFVLVIVAPILRRFDFRGRFLLILTTLFLFATLTRFEPSVLRASAMAAVAAVSVLLGRVGTSRRFLGVAVTALILLQPQIAHSLAFQLSAAASVGILVLGPPIVELVRGPRMLAEAIGVTTAAQLAVAPLIIMTFEELPVASLPANVLAGPAAGPAMMWGLVGGYLAGLVPGLAPVLHMPSAVLVGWIASVARVTAGWPLGSVGLAHVVVISATLTMLIASRKVVVRRLALVGLLIAVVHPAWVTNTASPESFDVSGTTRVWRDDRATVLELGNAPINDVLAALRQQRVTAIDLVVVPDGGLGDWDRLRSVRQRSSVRSVWSPSNRTIPGVLIPTEGQSLYVDEVLITIITTEQGNLAFDPIPHDS